MKTFLCRQCKNTVRIPELSTADKMKIRQLMEKSQRLHIIQWFREDKKTELVYAKTIVMHLASHTLQCNRCKHKIANDEYTNCPKCGAFHINW